MRSVEIASVVEEVSRRLFVEVEASGRHVHVTKEQAQLLFGHPLTHHRDLSQPGQFLARERVTVMGPKGRFEHVAVLGPERKEAQVEISLTDGRVLGIEPPIRLSGRVTDSPGVDLVGPRGRIALEQGVIAAQRHIHMTPEDAERQGVADRQMVKLQVFSRRPVIFEDVAVRVSPEYATYAHLDYDEANGCGLEKGDLGRILP